MKKIIALLLTVVLLFTVSACSNSREKNKHSAEFITESSTVQTTSNLNTSQKETTQQSENTMNIKINNKDFTAEFYDNETAKAFADMLPLTLDMNELHGNEKYYYLDHTLPTNSSYVGTIRNGDIMLYGNNCLVLFYDSFSTDYSYTKIGYIKNPTDLADAVGSGNVTISFEE